MALAIRVLSAGGALCDCTVGKVYPVEQVVERGGAYVFNGIRIGEADNDGYVFTDDLNESVAIRQGSDPDQRRWELVTE